MFRMGYRMPLGVSDGSRIAMSMEEEMTTPSANPDDDVLGGLVAQAVGYGADALEVEYKDGHEEVCAMRGYMGFSIAKLHDASEEARALRRLLHAIRRRGKTISTPAGDFRVTVLPYESFGETAYHVQIQARPRKSGPADPRAPGR